MMIPEVGSAAVHFTSENLRDLPVVDVAQFKENSTLCSQEALLLQLKGFNRAERLKRKTTQELKGEAGSSTLRPISDGAIIITDTIATATKISEIPKIKEYRTQDSRGIAFWRDKVFVGCVDRVNVIDCTSGQMEPFPIDSEWLAFIHSLATSPSGERMVIVSSGFDRIIEAEIATGKVTREWSASEHGRFLSKREGVSPVTPQSAKEFPGGLGLPPHLRLAFPNSAIYLDERTILATLFHHGLVKIDLQSGETNLVDGDLRHPHAIFPTETGYIVTDTSRGRVVCYDRALRRQKILDFSHLPGLSPESAGKEWLQYVKPLGEGRYLAVDSNRTALFIVDESEESYRRLALDPQWVVQEAHIL